MSTNSTNRYTDSIISSSQYYTNPYREDVDYRKAQRIEAGEKAVLDSIESPQQQLERELLEKILSKKKRFSVPFIIFKRLGKFFFMIAFFPPYVVFYGLPKLAIQHLGTFSKVLQEKIEIGLEKMTNRVKIITQRVYSGPFAFLSKQLSSLNDFIKQKNTVFQNKILMLKSKWIDPVFAFFKTKKEQIAASVNKIFAGIQFTMWMPKPLSLASFRTWNWSFPNLKLSFRIPYKTLLDKALLPLYAFKNRLASLKETIQKSIREPIELIMKQVNTAWLFLWQPISQLKLPTYDLSAFRQRTKVFIQQVIQLVKIPFKLVTQIQAVTSKALSLFTRKLRSLNQFLGRGKQTLASIKEKLNQTKQKVVDFLIVKGRKMASFFLRWLKKVASYFNRAKKSVLDILTFLVSHCLRISLFLLSFFQQFVLSIRILLALLSILFKFVFQSIKEQILSELTDKNTLEHQQKSE